MLVHPRGKSESGYTQGELRVFREMALDAGASQVFLWTGRPLTGAELLIRKPPSGLGEWE